VEKGTSSGRTKTKKDKASLIEKISNEKAQRESKKTFRKRKEENGPILNTDPGRRD